MILVLSHAWVLSEPGSAENYVKITDEFEDFHRAQRGFRGRRLVCDVGDPSHFINLRYWDQRRDYEAMVQDPAYPGWIARLSEHVQALDPQKLILDVVLDHPDPAGA